MVLIESSSQYKERAQLKLSDVELEDESSAADWYGHIPENYDAVKLPLVIRAIYLCRRYCDSGALLLGGSTLFIGKKGHDDYSNVLTIELRNKQQRRLFESYSYFHAVEKSKEGLSPEGSSPIIRDQSRISLKAGKEQREHY